MPDRWLIQSSEESKLPRHRKIRPLYWSEEMGWVTFDFATLFTTEQKDSGNVPLPRGGVWTKTLEG